MKILNKPTRFYNIAEWKNKKGQPRLLIDKVTFKEVLKELPKMFHEN